MQVRAGIDIGTNTILLLVVEVKAGAIVRVLEDHVRVVRLGQAVDKNRAFHPEAMNRARACFQEYSKILLKYPGVDVRAVATSGSRDATNSQEFFAQIARDFSIPIRVISGEEEALFSFRGALPEGTMDPQTLAVLDIGGGSTEIVGQSGAKMFRFSFDMGCVRLTERFFANDPPTTIELSAARNFVVSEFLNKADIFSELANKRLVGVAGTVTYLAATALELEKFDPEKVHGFTLTREKVGVLFKKFCGLTKAQRLGYGGMDAGRADVILAGAIILDEVMKRIEPQEIHVSVRGLRYGAVLD